MRKKQNKSNKRPDSWNQSTVWAAALLRPRRINNGGMSRGSHLGIRSLSRFGCLLQASREAASSGFAAHLTLWRFSTVLHKSSDGAKQPLIKWKKVHRSQVFTLLYPIADEGEARWVKKKKNHACVFLPSKRHCLSVAGGSSKEFLAHQIQQTKPQNKNLQFETLYPVTPVQLWWSCF